MFVEIALLLTSGAKMATAVSYNGTKMVAGLSPAVWECIIYFGTEGGDHTTVEDYSLGL